MSIATTTLWLVCYLLIQMFPIMQQSLGPAGTFWCFAGGALLTIILVAWLVPETKDKSLEEITRFWKAGEVMTFQVPTQTFTRKMADGTIGTVSRKGYTRRSAREDAWLYHLKELAAAEEPLRYMRRFLRVADELIEEEAAVEESISGDLDDEL